MDYDFSQSHSALLLPTWFLNDSVAGSGNLLSLCFIRVLVITEVALYTQSQPQPQPQPKPHRHTHTVIMTQQIKHYTVTFQPVHSSSSSSPLHNSQTLLPPGESAAPPQTEAPRGGAKGGRGLLPVHHVLQGQRGSSHGQSGA